MRSRFAVQLAAMHATQAQLAAMGKIADEMDQLCLDVAALKKEIWDPYLSTLALDGSAPEDRFR